MYLNYVLDCSFSDSPSFVKQLRTPSYPFRTSTFQHSVMSLDIELLDDDLMDNSFVRSLFGDTDSESATVWGGSRDGRSTNLHRAFRLAEERFHRDYFADSHINSSNGEVAAGPVYPEATFVKRYRMSTALFQKICLDLSAWDTYVTLKRDATGLTGITPEIKYCGFDPPVGELGSQGRRRSVFSIVRIHGVLPDGCRPSPLPASAVKRLMRSFCFCCKVPSAQAASQTGPSSQS